MITFFILSLLLLLFGTNQAKQICFRKKLLLHEVIGAHLL